MLNILASCARAEGGAAQAPDGFKFMSHETFSIPAGRVYGATFMNDITATCPAHWVDHITILSGEGVLAHGGTLSDAKESGPGEVRGGTMTGAVTQVLHAGDYFQIPPGMPHKLDAATLAMTMQGATGGGRASR